MKYYHSELMKNVLNQIAGSTNYLVGHFKKMSLNVREKRVVHETDHVNCLKNTACWK